MRDLAIIMSVSYGVYSGFKDFRSPIQVSPINNNSGLGFGALLIAQGRSWYSSSKVFDESSVINFGLINRGVKDTKYDLFYGGGIHTHLHEGVPKEDEENELNLNLGLSRNMDKFSLFADFDTGPRSLSIGLAAKY